MADINLGVGGANSATGGYDIANSLKLESDNGEVLTQTIGAGSRTTATYSFWFKRTELGAGMQIAGISPIGSETTRFLINSSDQLDVESGVGGDNNSLVTNRVFRDTSAWYHFVVAIDTTQATEANRVKVYVNGVQETSFSASEYPAQNTNLTIGVSGYTWSWGAYSTTQIKSSGYLAEAYYIDAQQLDPTSFGEFDEDTGIWKPIAYTGSFGSNGHYLDFSDAGDLGNNSSGVGNDFTLNNITSADQATDTPTNNFCTLNPLMENTGSANYLTLTEGATKTVNSSASYKARVASMGVTKGKWYWEMTSTQFTVVSTLGVNYPENWSSGTSFFGTMYVNDNGTGVRYNNSSRIPNFGNGWSSTTINIGFALDMDATPPTCTVYENGSSIGNLMAGLSINGAGGAYLPPKEVGYFPYISNYSNNTILANFGGYTAASISSAASDENGYGTFEYAPPSGYYALCTKNLAEYG